MADLLARLLDASRAIAFVECDAAGVITRANPAFTSHVAGPGSGLAGRSLTTVLAAAESDRVRAWLAGPTPGAAVRVNFVSDDGAPFTLRCLVHRAGDRLQLVGEPETGDRTAAEELMRLNNELATVARERARRQRELERTRRELESALEELRTSYWHLQKIQEVLPLCMHCGKVKTDDARWESVIDYMKANRIFLSHGYCPSCTDIVYREHGLEP